MKTRKRRQDPDAEYNFWQSATDMMSALVYVLLLIIALLGLYLLSDHTGLEEPSSSSEEAASSGWHDDDYDGWHDGGADDESEDLIPAHVDAEGAGGGGVGKAVEPVAPVGILLLPAGPAGGAGSRPDRHMIWCPQDLIHKDGPPCSLISEKDGPTGRSTIAKL